MRTKVLHLAALFAATAIQFSSAAAASSPRPSPPPPPPAPRPAPAPARSPAPAAAPQVQTKPAAAFQAVTTTYKATTMTPPAATMPNRAGLAPTSTAGTKQPGYTAVTQRAAGSTAGGGAATTQAAKPAVRVQGLSVAQSASLAPSVQRFESRYRDVQVVHEPTTSGWTWLFLWWALSNSDENHRLQEQNDELRSQMQSLEADLRKDPDQWAQLQALAAQPEPQPADAASSLGEGVTAVSSASAPDARQALGDIARDVTGQPADADPLFVFFGALPWLLLPMAFLVGLFYILRGK